jgi:hypothetical protein
LLFESRYVCAFWSCFCPFDVAALEGSVVRVEGVGVDQAAGDSRAQGSSLVVADDFGCRRSDIEEPGESADKPR